MPKLSAQKTQPGSVIPLCALTLEISASTALDRYFSVYLGIHFTVFYLLCPYRIIRLGTLFSLTYTESTAFYLKSKCNL